MSTPASWTPAVGGEARKILVIKLGALGDFVLALAAARRIREAHPDARITLLTTPPFETLGKLSPYFDEVQTDGRPEGIKGWLALVGRLRRAGYDRIYDLQTSSRSSSYFYGLLPFAPQWSGIAKGCALPHRNPRRNQMHTLERQADQLEDAGIWPNAPTEHGAAPPPDLSWMFRSGEQPYSRPYALLIPGGSAHRPEKRWPAERYGEMAAWLNAQGYDAVVVGGAQEGPLARLIGKAAPRVRDLTGRTNFAQIAALAAHAAVVVGNDTGPTHLAAATGAPTIALFSGASDPALCAPRGHVLVVREPDLGDLALATVATAAAALLPAAPISREA